MMKWIVRFLWTLLILVVLGAAMAFYAIDQGWIGYMPPIEDLQNPINRYATQVYSSDGKLLGTWNYNRENRSLKTPLELSQALKSVWTMLQESLNLFQIRIRLRLWTPTVLWSSIRGPRPICRLPEGSLKPSFSVQFCPCFWLWQAMLPTKSTSLGRKHGKAASPESKWRLITKFSKRIVVSSLL